MMIYLVLFDAHSVAYSSKIDSGLEEHIAPDYPRAKKASLGALFRDEFRPEPFMDSFGGAAPDFAYAPASMDEDAALNEEPEDYTDKDLSFAEMCEWWCARKDLTKKEFYIYSNINKSMFWNMKHHPEQTPRKTNALACAIGLRLDYEQTQDLLMRAGLTLSPYYALDRTVEGFIHRGNYNIYEINEALFEQDLPLLGAV